MKKIFLSIAAIGMLFTSCEKFSDGLNTDPNNFTDAPAALVIGQAQLEAVKLSESQASRYAGLFTDQFSGCERQYTPYETYTVAAGDFDDTWDDLYADGIAQAQFVQEKAVEEGAPVLQGVGQIFEAMLFGEAAALFGNVPFSEAGDPIQFPNPKYDDQATVFTGVQSILSEAIANVGNATVSAAFGGNIFVSNSATWSQVAHSLKARYYLVAKDYDNAYTEAQMGIDAASGELLARHGQNTGEKNLYYQFTVEQRDGYLGICNDPYLMQLLDGSTPRKLMTPGDTRRLAIYFDKANSGINTGDGGYFAIDASFPIVSFIETRLIEAEAAVRTGKDGNTPFNAVRTYLASTYDGAFPPSTAAGDQLLAQILEEKYISLPGSLQVFHDARRTKNLIGIPIKGSKNKNLPQRFLYPQVEINANKNFPGLVELFVPTPANK